MWGQTMPHAPSPREHPAPCTSGTALPLPCTPASHAHFLLAAMTEDWCMPDKHWRPVHGRLLAPGPLGGAGKAGIEPAARAVALLSFMDTSRGQGRSRTDIRPVFPLVEASTAPGAACPLTAHPCPRCGTTPRRNARYAARDPRTPGVSICCKTRGYQDAHLGLGVRNALPRCFVGDSGGCQGLALMPRAQSGSIPSP